MQKAELQRHFMEVLRAIQADAGETCPELEGATVPLKDLPNFDSLAGVDAEARLSEVLGVELEKIPFQTDGRELSISEIVDELLAAALGEGRAK